MWPKPEQQELCQISNGEGGGLNSRSMSIGSCGATYKNLMAGWLNG